MAKRIGLSGKPLAGKTTLARLLVEKYGYRRAGMSDFLIEKYIELMNEPWMVLARGGFLYTTEFIHEHKADYRRALQQLGDDLGFQDPERVVCIMQQVLKGCGAWYQPESPVVLEAVRGELQASAARALGFVVVDVWIDSDTQYSRAANEEVYRKVREATLTRPDIEMGVSSAAIRLTPELPLENMALLLARLPEEGLYNGPADQSFQPYSLADWSSL